MPEDPLLSRDYDIGVELFLCGEPRVEQKTKGSSAEVRSTQASSEQHTAGPRCKATFHATTRYGVDR
jgi:hypothetical protein